MVREATIFLRSISFGHLIEAHTCSVLLRWHFRCDWHQIFRVGLTESTHSIAALGDGLCGSPVWPRFFSVIFWLKVVCMLTLCLYLLQFIKLFKAVAFVIHPAWCPLFVYFVTFDLIFRDLNVPCNIASNVTHYLSIFFIIDYQWVWILLDLILWLSLDLFFQMLFWRRFLVDSTCICHRMVVSGRSWSLTIWNRDEPTTPRHLFCTLLFKPSCSKDDSRAVFMLQVVL